MRVAVPKESAPGERRVALVPETVSKLRESGFESRVERGAGEERAFPTTTTRRPEPSSSREPRCTSGADALVCVAPPSAELAGRLAPGTVVVGFLEPLTDAAGIARLREREVVGFAMESIPRITRAQSMDALSSQATVSGYKAVLLAADRVPRLFPMLMTAAGTIAPVRALVIGAGVAGLQAIATARRLGAVVSAFDVRPAVAEQVREPRRDVPRSRGAHGGDRGRLRERAHARAAGAAAGGARGADPGLRRRRHHRRRPRPARAEAHPGERRRAHAAGLRHRRPRGRHGRKLRGDRAGRDRRARRSDGDRHAQPPGDDGVPREPALLAQRRRAPPPPRARGRARARLGGRDHDAAPASHEPKATGA